MAKKSKTEEVTTSGDLQLRAKETEVKEKIGTPIKKDPTTIHYKDLLPIPITETKVFIYSVPRKSVFGLDQWMNDASGVRLKKTKIGKYANDKIQALYSPKVGGLLNGLSYKTWVHEGKKVVDDKGMPLTLQDKFELKWNLPKGFLNNRAWKRGDSPKEADMTYYQTHRWTLKDGATMFNTKNMDDDLGLQMFLDSKFVANSQEEHQKHKWPKATHYIAHTGEDQNLKYKKTAYKSKAFAALESQDMTLPMKRKFVHILELASSTSSLTEQQIHNLLFEFIESSDFQPGSNLDKFMELVELLKTPTGREEIDARHVLKRAIDTRVIYERQGSYNWPKSDGMIVIGENKNEAIAFILSPKKQVLVEELEAEIKAKLAV